MTLVRLAQSTDDVGAIGSKYSRHWCDWLRVQMMLVPLAQNTADIGEIGSEYR